MFNWIKRLFIPLQPIKAKKSAVDYMTPEERAEFRKSILDAIEDAKNEARKRKEFADVDIKAISYREAEAIINAIYEDVAAELFDKGIPGSDIY